MEEVITKESIGKEIDETLKSVESDINGSMGSVIEDEEAYGKAPVYIIHTLNLLKNDSGIVFGDQASLENVTFNGEAKEDTSEDDNKVDKNCIVADKERLSKWLTQHYEDFEMAFILALAVFEKLPCMWVYEMAEDLFGLMEGDKEEASQNRIRIPHQKRIETVGGRIYQNYIYNHTGRVQEEFICFQNIEYAPRVLECVWDEFRYFREQLIGWLEKYISKTNYSKTIRAINALSKLLQHDFSYFERKAIKPLLDSNDYIADFAVAQIMLQTHENKRYKENVEKLYLYWTKQGRIHVSLITLMMCAAKGWTQEQIKPGIANYVDIIILAKEKSLDNIYERQLPLLYAIGDRRAVYFKTIVEVLYEKLMQYNSRKDRDRQRIIGIIFWQLIVIDDRESNIDVNRPEKHQDMIFVKMCLMKNEEASKLQELWKYIWKSRDMHKQTKKFLERYIFQYGGCNDGHINYLRQFLYGFQDTELDKKDMEFFLKKISLQNKRTVRTAEKINQRSE